MKTITIYLDKPHQVIDESHEDFQFQTFQFVYKKSETELNKIVQSLTVFKKEFQDGNRDISSCPNNILAFTGNRGTGKTSSMTSFISLVKKTDSKEYNHLRKEIHFFNILDPSTFQPSDSILGALVGKMFEEYSKKKLEIDSTNKTNSRQLIELEEKLTTRFQNVLIDIQTINLKKTPFGDPRDPDNPFYTLSRLASSTELKKNLTELIGTFLDFISCIENTPTSEKEGSERSNKKFIALTIDDLDLNVGSVFPIIEELRKFLCIPNLVILCSLRIEQVSHAISEYYISHLHNTISHLEPSEFHAEVEEMTEYYIEKIFPASRNVEMPPLFTRSWLRDPNCRIVLKGPEIVILGSNENNKNAEHSLLEYLSQKIGILFIPKQDRIHPIIPKTLREMSNFLNLIYKLENDNSSRLRVFYDYFLSKYPRLNLTYEYEMCLKRFMDVSLELRNNYLINKWESLFPISSNYLAILPNSSDYKSKNQYNLLLDRKKLSKEKSHLSDVSEILQLIENIDQSEDEVRLAFIIKTIVSLNIQIEINNPNSKLISALVGESLINPNITRAALKFDTLESVNISTQKSQIKHSKQEITAINFALQTFVFPTKDTRWDVEPARSLFEADFDFAQILTIDPFFAPIWNINRNKFFDFYSSGEKENAEKQQISESDIFGNNEYWKIFYNLELIERLVNEMSKQIRKTLKNKLAIDKFEDSSFADRMAVFIKSFEQNLLELDFRFGNINLHDIFCSIPIFNIFLDYKNNEISKMLLNGNEINFLIDPNGDTNEKEIDKRFEIRPPKNQPIFEAKLLHYKNRFEEYKSKKNNRGHVFPTITAFLVEFHDNLSENDSRIGRELSNNFNMQKSRQNREKVLNWCLEKINSLVSK